YEPEHIRGRSLASYNGNANLDNAFTVIWGAVDQGYTISTTGATPSAPQTLMYSRVITYTREPQGLLIANNQPIPATVNSPVITGGIPTLGSCITFPVPSGTTPWPALPAPCSHTVPQFINPDNVVQRTKLAQPSPNNQLGTPFIYVGDDRPHRV